MFQVVEGIHQLLAFVLIQAGDHRLDAGCFGLGGDRTEVLGVNLFDIEFANHLRSLSSSDRGGFLRVLDRGLAGSSGELAAVFVNNHHSLNVPQGERSEHHPGLRLSEVKIPNMVG